MRLGSVYGYAEKSRMFNLPNLFALRAKMNLDLKLFSKGVQIKSIISSKDVARAMVFLSKKKFNRELFHFASEHISVKKLENFAKNIIKIKLISTKDKIPYLGYYINCNKLLKTGFRFKNYYKDFIKDYLK